MSQLFSFQLGFRKIFKHITFIPCPSLLGGHTCNLSFRYEFDIEISRLCFWLITIFFEDDRWWENEEELKRWSSQEFVEVGKCGADILQFLNDYFISTCEVEGSKHLTFWSNVYILTSWTIFNLEKHIHGKPGS